MGDTFNHTGAAFSQQRIEGDQFINLQVKLKETLKDLGWRSLLCRPLHHEPSQDDA